MSPHVRCHVSMQHGLRAAFSFACLLMGSRFPPVLSLTAQVYMVRMHHQLSKFVAAVHRPTVRLHEAVRAAIHCIEACFPGMMLPHKGNVSHRYMCS